MKRINATISVIVTAALASVCIASVCAEDNILNEQKSKVVGAEKAVELLLDEGIEPLNITSTGNENQIGMFSVPENMGLPFNEGILISTGDVNSIFGNQLASKQWGNDGNEELKQIYQSEGFKNSTYDAATLSFDIVPTASELSFNFFYASTEYNQAARYNDVFAFWIIDSETGERFNIAKTPFGKNVNVQNTVTKNDKNTPTYTINGKYYNYVENTSLNDYNFGFLGYTNQFVADAGDLINSLGNKVILENKPVTVEIAITDCADATHDSVIFIQSGSFKYESFEKEIHTISFDTNNMSDDVFENIETGTDGTIEKLLIPKCNTETHQFAGWFTDPIEGEKVSVNTVFKEDTTLYAHWSTDSYTITFDVDGGETINDIMYTNNDKIIIPETTKNGYDFIGWRIVNGEDFWDTKGIIYSGVSLENIYGNVVLKAIYNAKPTEMPTIVVTEPSTVIIETSPTITESTTVPTTSETQSITKPATQPSTERIMTDSTKPTNTLVKSKDNSVVETGAFFPILFILTAISSGAVLIVLTNHNEKKENRNLSE